MSAQEKKFHEWITVVEFRAFDKQCEEHFFDSTPSQITTYIFKNICNTAVIKNITEYHFGEDQIIPIKKFQTQIP